MEDGQMTRFLTVLVPVLVLGMATGARAATYESPTLSAGGGATGGILICNVTNVGKKPIEVTGSLLAPNGTVIVASDACSVGVNGALAAGHNCTIGLVGPITARCRVEASGKIRAALTVLDSAFNTTAAVPLTK
jgi:hypothetical protein